MISEEELYRHRSKSELWIAIRGKVYDVSAFLDDHPGGPEILQQHGGQDVTHYFEEVFHSPAAEERMKQFYIGHLD